MKAEPTLSARVHRRILDELRPGEAVTAARLAAAARAEDPLLGPAALDSLVRDLLSEVRGLGPLDPLLSDPAVTDVLVNGDGSVWVESGGALRRTPVVLDADERAHLVEKVVAPLGLRVDRTVPYVDARLADGSRVHAVVPPVAVDGPCLTIRRFGAKAIPLAAFCPPPVAALLRWAVRARQNLLVAGGTGSGKTTLLNALASAIPAGERIVTIEDAAELRLPQDHVVRLEARPANAEGVGAVSCRDLVRNALRMRPDRIVVGECRGGEAFDMVQAMNTGHEGSMSTCHANSPADALRRLETMVLMADVALPLAAVRDHLRASVDIVVHVARQGARRAVTAVAEVQDDGTASGGIAVRALADRDRVTSIPARTPRRDGPAPDPAWVAR